MTGKKRLIKLSITALMMFAGLLLVLFFMSLFFDKFQLTFQSPVILQRPILIKEREHSYINPLIEPVVAWEASTPQELGSFLDRSSPEPLLVQPRDWDEVLHMIVDNWSEYGKEETLKAIKTFYCESKWEEKAYNLNTNGSYDSGVAQINSVHNQDKDDLMRADYNLEYAKQLFEDQGWGPWVCAR